MLDVTLAPPLRHRALTVFPLIAPRAPELPYALLSEALEDGRLRITEVGTGTVPSVLAISKHDLDILVLDGEQLIGARQNRMTNRSLLLAAGSETVIPVSCMEQGRWHHVSDQFAPGKYHSPSLVRRRSRETEASSLAAGAPPTPQVLASAQHGVWDSIEINARDLDTHSGTGALNEAFDAREHEIDEVVAAMPAADDQVGILAFVGLRPLALDLIGGHALYSRVHQRLLRGYAMDALAARGGREPDSERAQGFLDLVRGAARSDAPTVGRGRYAVLGDLVIGGELTDRDHVVHLSAFPARDPRREASSDTPHTDPIAPPSRRRRR
jgi:hypothetical protein